MKKSFLTRALAILFLLAACNSYRQFDPAPMPAASPSPRQALVPVPSPAEYLQPLRVGSIARVWANEGGDKVTRDELRASLSTEGVLNSGWDGVSLKLFGAGNEVVAFNLVLEAPESAARAVSVALPYLAGPEGFLISDRNGAGENLFNYLGRDIELFYIRYLQVNGISTDLFFAGYSYDERHLPERCQLSLNSAGERAGGWEDRPCRDLFYPEIAVPLELETPFEISPGSSQSIWGDIYIPPSAPPGTYSGLIAVKESDQLIWEVPVQLEVLDFDLPDLPAARTMLYISRENIKEAYLGKPELNDLDREFNRIIDRHFQLAHRHKISLIDSYLPLEAVEQVWTGRLDGELFSADQGYAGIGTGVGNNVYSIGTYGEWPWRGENRQAMWEQADQWVSWFDDLDLATPTEYFLYLSDESDDYRLLEKWSHWIKQDPGPGSRLLTLATLDLPVGVERVPSLAIPASWARFGITEDWQGAAAICREDIQKRLYLYNSNRPATGSFALEDDGTALRQLAWAQYKMGVDRWFYWEGTYYTNFQCYGDGPESRTNVFLQAQTYGCLEGWDESLGETGWNYLNGDGVLFYPGTDRRFPDESYGLAGPLASLRLKHWRRGIQDVDYLVMAAAVNPERTAAIVQSMVPAVLWELGVADPEDPTYVYGEISWPSDPDCWEAARKELAEIILSGMKRR